ncbi:MAG: hypothetical protein ACI83Y_001736 [Candidatus Azotimanducaceae bacterium]|jgi:hypothetical protein
MASDPSGIRHLFCRRVLDNTGAGQTGALARNRPPTFESARRVSPDPRTRCHTRSVARHPISPAQGPHLRPSAPDCSPDPSFAARRRRAWFGGGPLGQAVGEIAAGLARSPSPRLVVRAFPVGLAGSCVRAVGGHTTCRSRPPAPHELARRTAASETRTPHDRPTAASAGRQGRRCAMTCRGCPAQPRRRPLPMERENATVLPGPTEEPHAHHKPRHDDRQPGGDGAWHLPVECIRMRSTRVNSIDPPRATHRDSTTSARRATRLRSTRPAGYGLSNAAAASAASLCWPGITCPYVSSVKLTDE